MPYGVVDDVKASLHIAVNITGQDPEFLRMIQLADDFINTILQMFVTIPLANPIPDQIRRLSNKLAIEWYYHYNTPMHPMEGIDSVKKEIETYIRAVYGKLSDTIGQNRISKASGAPSTGD